MTALSSSPPIDTALPATQGRAASSGRGRASGRAGLGGLVALFAVDKVVLKLADSVATAGFIGRLGSARLPWLWTADMVFTLLTGAALLRAVDRVPHATLVRRLALALGGLYLLAAVGAWAHLPGEWVYTLTYLLSAQQTVVLPTVLWVLANARVPAAQAPRVLPRIAAGETVGQVVGYVLCAVLGWLGTRLVGDRELLLLAASGCALVAALSVSQATRARSATSRPANDESDEGESSFPALSVRQLLARHRVLVPLGGTVVLNWVGTTTLAFHVIATLERASAGASSSGRFRMLYALYNVGSIVAILAAQALLSARLLPRLRRTAALGLFPAVLAVSLAIPALFTGAAGAIAGAFLMYLAYDAWDMPARHSLLATLPDEVRGRATTLIDSHAYALGSVLGSVMLGLVLLVCERAGAPAVRASQAYLALGGCAALGASVLARRLRKGAFAS